jgi:hypothetical protein
LALAALLVSCAGQDAQRSPPQGNIAATRARAAYDACVDRAGAAILQQTHSMNIDAVTEAAFQACLTEEGVMRSIMMNVGAPQSMTETLIYSIKSDNKRRILAIWNANRPQN